MVDDESIKHLHRPLVSGVLDAKRGSRAFSYRFVTRGLPDATSGDAFRMQKCNPLADRGRSSHTIEFEKVGESIREAARATGRRFKLE